VEWSLSWEAKSYLASQEISRLIRNSRFHFRVHNDPPLVPYLSQMHPVHNFPPCFPEIRSNIILPSLPKSSEWSLPFRYFNQNIVLIYLSHAFCIPCLTIPPWFYDLIMISAVYKFCSSSLYGLLQPPATSSTFDPNNLISTLIQNTLDLSYSLSVRHRFTPLQNNR